MTTRSKKRLQTSLGENSDISIPKSERKTRSQRIKDEEFNHSLPKPKKRNNYVSYPSTDEEIKENDVNKPIVPHKHERKILRCTLNEKNTDSAVDTNENERKTRKSTRLTKRGRKSIDKQYENDENVTLEVDNKNIIVANAESIKKKVLKRMKGKDRKISKTAEALPDFIPEVDIKVPLSLKTSNERSVKKLRCNSKKVFDDTDMMETDDIITDEKNNHYKKADQISLQPVTRSKVCKNNQDSNTLQVEMIENVLAEENMGKTLENVSGATDSKQNSTKTKKHRRYVKVRKSHITQNQNNITVNDEQYKHSLSPFVSHPKIIDNKSGELNALKTKTSKIIKAVDISREEIIDDKENRASMKKSNSEITPSADKKAKNTSFATTEVKSLIYNKSNENSPNNNFDSKSESNRHSIKNSTYDKIDVITPKLNSTYDKNTSSVIIHNNTTYDKDDVRNSLSFATTEVKSLIYNESNENSPNNNFDSKSESNRHSIKNSTYDKIDVITPKLNSTYDKNTSSVIIHNNTTYDKDDVRNSLSFATTEVKSLIYNESNENSPNNNFDSKSESNRQSIKNSTYDKIDVITPKLNSTYDKNTSSVIIHNNTTYDKDDVRNSLSFATTEVKSLIYNESNENSPNNNFYSKSESNRHSIKNSTYDKIDVITPKLNSTYDKNTSSVIIHNNTTYDKDDVRNSLSIKPVKLNDKFDKIPDTGCSAINERNEKKSLILGTISGNSTFDHQINSTKHSISERFKNDENLNNTGVKISLDKDHNSTQSSLISSDASTTAGNITDDNSVVNISENSNYNDLINATPIIIESSLSESNINEIFVDNNDDHDVSESKDNSKNTPENQKSLSAPGLTPYNSNHNSSQKVKQLNLTHSIEKSRRSSVSDEQLRVTKVTFFSPTDNPEIRNKGSKVVKSSLKGSNKSFIFVQNEVPGTRKRLRSHSEVQALAKHTNLTEELQHSVNRLSRPKNNINAGKQPGATTPNRKIVKHTSSSDSKDRRKARLVPNFAALHKKNFDKMESIADFRERKAKRARRLLTPTGKPTVLERSPRDEMDTQEKLNKAPEEPQKVPTLMSLRPGYTRFGFKLDVDVNPFTVAIKPEAKKLKKTELKRPPTMPFLSGVTTRKEYAKTTVMREKSFTSTTEKREAERKDYRSIIKGVRSNRRFELQMKLRVINN